MSLPARLADEAVEFLHAALLWFLLLPAFAPATVAVSALPGSAPRSELYGWLPAAVAVAVVRYYDPSWDLLRAFVTGLGTGLVFVVLYAIADVGRAVDAGGSWAAVGVAVAAWAVALGIGIGLAHPRTWRRLRRSVAVE